MNRSFLFWILALVLTLASAYYQRKTGPTYPLDGKASLAGESISWTLGRSHGGAGDQPVRVYVGKSSAEGTLFCKRFKSDDEWSSVPMTRRGDTLIAMLPHQPPAGKLEYAVELRAGSAVLRVPEHESIVTRFKGDVPLGVLIPHVIAMFAAMLFSMRAGIEAFRRQGSFRSVVLWTSILMAIGGLIFGPIVQKYAFGAYWTGFPFGTDLTDNKTLIAFIAWIIALALIWKKDAPSSRRWYVLAASIVTLAVYLIPHSTMGSELDYRKLDRLQMQQQQQDSTIAAPTPSRDAP